MAEEQAKPQAKVVVDDANLTPEERAKRDEREARKKEKEREKEAKVAKLAAKKEAAAAKAVAPAVAAADKKPKKAKPEADKSSAQPFVNTTPKGEKKVTAPEMAAGYEPAAVESAWYDWWEKSGFFRPREDAKEHFTMVIPPPNVTGSLHIGHALTSAVQDTFVRWHRMHGRASLWVPGTDHAGIATQVVVEKKLMRERGVTRHELGRDAFVAEVWKWKEQYGDRIFDQLRRMGASVDWERAVFTMDEIRGRSVTAAFVEMYERKFIYRATRLVNWCCTLKTAVSDIEVDYLDVDAPLMRAVQGHPADKLYPFGWLWQFAYKVKGTDEKIVVATTRPETMLADTAVAVHPEDPRYKHLHGKMLEHPFVAREIPVITDAVLVDMAFGTGAVKVTPAHDPNDYETGKRHSLEFINLFTDEGLINDKGGEFVGMKRFDCREKLLARLEELGLMVGKQANVMRIGICSRTGDIIEPVLRPQWWVECKQLAADAAQAARTGELEFVPATHKDTWFRWLDNIRDWCISRQLWWGHRIPAYLVHIADRPAPESHKPEHWVVAATPQAAREAALARHPDVDPAHIRLEQDPDVLDTWFSAGLFPFSVFGWPEKTPDLERFYPTSVLETGHDILFFWVARMVMMGQCLTGKLPFTKVLLHAMVRDAHGRKMSKSLGNVIDPIDVIEGIALEKLHDKVREGNLDAKEVTKAIQAQKEDFPNGIGECGTDALRFALCAYTTQGRDINLDINRVVAYRHFCNKLWNATRFALSHLGPNFTPAATAGIPEAASTEDRWILSRLASATAQCNAGIDQFDFGTATSSVHSFWLYDLCDFYLEASKPVMKADTSDAGNAARKRAAQETLYTCLDYGLRLLHPFMPFVTEELWQRLARRSTETAPSIVVAAFPTDSATGEWLNVTVEKDVAFVRELIASVRSMRSANNLTPKQQPQIIVNCHTEALVESVQRCAVAMQVLCYSSGLPSVVLNTPAPAGCAVTVASPDCEVYMLIKGLIDVEAELVKLEKVRVRADQDLARYRALTQKADYSRVPEKVRLQNDEKIVSLEKELLTIAGTVENFKALRME